jgi:hypothetical protein
MYFDRFDICQAYATFAYGYHVGGYATGRRESFIGETNSDINVRLHRMHYRESPMFGYRRRDLTDNGRRIYDRLVRNRIK